MVRQPLELPENIRSILQTAQIGVVQRVVVDGIAGIVVIVTPVGAYDGCGKPARGIAAHDVQVGLDGALADAARHTELLMHLHGYFGDEIVEGPLPELVAETTVDDTVTETGVFVLRHIKIMLKVEC